MDRLAESAVDPGRRISPTANAIWNTCRRRHVSVAACNRVIRRRRADPMSDEQTVPVPGFEEGDEPLDAYSRIVTQVAQELLPHVASVRVRGSRAGYSYEGAGSAVVFTDDGYIVTNAHVVGRTQRGTAAFADGAEVQFDVVGSDPLSDLAIVRARG